MEVLLFCCSVSKSIFMDIISFELSDHFLVIRTFIYFSIFPGEQTNLDSLGNLLKGA